MNKEDLEAIEYGFEEVFIFMMDVAYLSFLNTIGVFDGSKVPIPLDFADDAWPTERHYEDDEVDV